MGALGRAVVAATLLVITGCGSDDLDGIDVGDPWARPTPAGTDVAAVYLTLRSGSDDALVGVDVDPAIAGAATMHETVDAGGGMMSMRELDTLALPAGEEVLIEPGGTHIMLEGLADPLEAGASFELTLQFEQAGAQTVDVEVREASG